PADVLVPDVPLLAFVAKTCRLWQICVQGTFGNLVKPASATAFVVGVPDANLDTINVGNNLATAIALQVAALGDCGVTPNLIIAKHISSPVPCAIAKVLTFSMNSMSPLYPKWC